MDNAAGDSDPDAARRQRVPRVRRRLAAHRRPRRVHHQLAAVRRAGPPANYPAAVQKAAAARLDSPAAHAVSHGRGQRRDQRGSDQRTDARSRRCTGRSRTRRTITPQNIAAPQGARRRRRPARLPAIWPARRRSGPPYRTIVDSGITVGAGSDSAQISTLNPWLMLYYMVDRQEHARASSSTPARPLTRAGGAAALHGRERLVQQGRGQARHRSSPASSPTSSC